MERKEIKDEAFRVWFDPGSVTVFFEGTLRLSTADYRPISDMLAAAIAERPPHLTLNLSELTFLNSSGINMLYKFAIALRKQGGTELAVRGSSEVGWQSKSLANIKRFLPNTTLTLH